VKQIDDAIKKLVREVRLHPVVSAIVLAVLLIIVIGLAKAIPSNLSIMWGGQQPGSKARTVGASAGVTSLEAEDGQIMGSAITENNTLASGGRNVLFKAAPKTVRGSVPGIPPQGALFGMFSDPNPQISSGIGRIEERIGRKLDMRMQFIDFKTGGGGLLDLLNNGFIADDINNNRVPVISWQTSTWNAGLSENNMGAIAAGQYDTYLTNVAKKLKAYNKPIQLRFAHEMNGNWYGWSKASTTEYKNAWRHAHKLFTDAGATNVTWNWCPFWINIGKNFVDYYPGDEYVDIVGIDVYVEQVGKTLGDTLNNGPGSVYDTYKSKKPIFIMESMSGPRGGNFFQDKTNYFNQMASVLQNKFPDISGVVLFDENKLSNEGADFSIEKTSNGGANTNNMNAFANMAKNCYFGTNTRQTACKNQ
jgi:hypothetical protein